jgi:hypothetical protein
VGIVTESDFLHRDELGVSPPCNWLEALLGIEEVDASGSACARFVSLRS